MENGDCAGKSLTRTHEKLKSLFGLPARLSSDNKTSESKPLKITQILRSPMKKIQYIPYKITQYMQCEKAKLEVYSLQPSLIVACFIAISQDTINVTHLLISSRTILEHRREQPEPG